MDSTGAEKRACSSTQQCSTKCRDEGLSFICGKLKKKTSVAYQCYITFKIHDKFLIVLLSVSLQVLISELYDRTDKSPSLVRDGCVSKGLIEHLR